MLTGIAVVLASAAWSDRHKEFPAIGDSHLTKCVNRDSFIDSITIGIKALIASCPIIICLLDSINDSLTEGLRLRAIVGIRRRSRMLVNSSFNRLYKDPRIIIATTSISTISICPILFLVPIKKGLGLTALAGIDIDTK